MADINPSDKAPLTCSFTARVRIHSVEGELTVGSGTLSQIRDAVGKSCARFVGSSSSRYHASGSVHRRTNPFVPSTEQS